MPRPPIQLSQSRKSILRYLSHCRRQKRRSWNFLENAKVGRSGFPPAVTKQPAHCVVRPTPFMTPWDAQLCRLRLARHTDGSRGCARPPARRGCELLPPRAKIGHRSVDHPVRESAEPPPPPPATGPRTRAAPGKRHAMPGRLPPRLMAIPAFPGTGPCLDAMPISREPPSVRTRRRPTTFCTRLSKSP